MGSCSMVHVQKMLRSKGRSQVDDLGLQNKCFPTLFFLSHSSYFESLAKCFANDEKNILYGLSSEFDATD